MSALTDGFNSAFGAMQSHYDRQENNKRYEQGQQRQSALDIKADERYNAGLAQNNERYNDAQVRQSALDGQRNEAHNLQMANQDLQQTVNQNSVDQIPIQNAQNAKQFEQNQNQQAETKLQEEAAYLLQGNNPDATSSWMIKNAEALQASNMGVLLDPTKFKAVLSLGDMMDSGQMEGVPKLINTVFDKQIGKAVGKNGRFGSVISKVEVTGIQPVEGGRAKVRLKVYTEDGKSYPTHASEMRSAEDGDPAKAYDMNELIDTIGSLNDTAKTLQASGQHQSFLQSVARKNQAGQKPNKPDWREIKAIDENGFEQVVAFQNVNTGESQPVSQQAQSAAVLAKETPEQKQDKVNAAKDKSLNILAQGLAKKFPNLSEGGRSAVAKSVMQAVNNGDPRDKNEIVNEEAEKLIKIESDNKQQTAQNKASALNNVSNINVRGL